MKVLVTGGTGFIGSHLIDRLLEQNRNIRVLVKKESIDEIETYNLNRLKEQNIELVYGDLREKKSLNNILKDVDVVFHLAAISRPMNIKKKIYYDTNVQGTRNLLELCKNIKLLRFIHVSTVSVLGVSPDGHSLKEDEFQNETQDYGLSKRQGERVAIEYYQKYNMPITIIRPPLMYGPRCIVRSFIFKAVKFGFFPLFKGGHAKMEFCYVDNLVDALLLAEKDKGAIGEVFNVTDGKSYEIQEVIRTIQKHLKIKNIITFFPVWLGISLGYIMEWISKLIGIYPPFSHTAAKWLSQDMNVYDCSKAKEILGYNPKVSLDEGVERTIIWYKRNNVL